MKHPTSIDGYTLKEAAHKIGKMRYDALAEFLKELCDEMEFQRISDDVVGKKQLAQDAKLLVASLNQASVNADMLFQKYKKFMKDEI